MTNTFSCHQSESGLAGSFILPNGLTLACDYVLLNGGASVAKGSCSVWADFNMLNRKHDHLPVCVDVVFQCVKALPVTRRRVPTYDRWAIQNASTSEDPKVLEKVIELEAYLMGMPDVPVQVDPTSHDHLVDCYILEGVEAFFPPPPRPKKQEYISQATFDLIGQRARVSKAYLGTVWQLAISQIWFVMRFWKATVASARPWLFQHKVSRPWWGSVRGPKTRAMCLKQLRLRNEYWRLSVLVKEACHEDFLKVCGDKCRQLEEATLECCTRAMYALLRGLRPWVPRRECRLMNDKGLPASSDFEERSIVKVHFQKKLEGSDTTLQILIDQERLQYADRAAESAAMDKSLDAIPTITYLVGRHACCKKNGTGENRLGGEISKLLPRVMATIMHPLHCKAALFIRLPVQWLGGCGQELMKASGSRSEIGSYREITLADLSGKHFGGFVRASLMVAVVALSGSNQFGAGLNGGTTDLAHLPISQTLSYARTVRKAGGVLFVDVIGAFASVSRRISVPQLPESEEAWRRHLVNRGFSMQRSDEIVSMSISVLQWEIAGASEHSVALLTQIHKCTWMSIDGLARVSRCTSGTLAGTSLAEVVFILAVACITHSINCSLNIADLDHSLAMQPAVE